MSTADRLKATRAGIRAGALAIRCQARKEPEMTHDPTPQQKTTTIGELIQGLKAGTYTRQQVKEAIRPLDVIHWGVKVPEPAPAKETELEMGA
jgi:hypothetical protein